MSDDLHSRGGSDRQRIDIHQYHELRDWSKRLGVSREELEQAVRTVGSQADRVEEYLKSGGQAGDRAGDERSVKPLQPR